MARRRGRGFTLIEVLTAVAVLTLLMAILGQLVGTMSTTWLEGQRRVNNFTKGRAMLDLFVFDVQSGVFRPDLAAFPSNTAAFYTKRSGVSSSPGGSASGNRSLCLVQYGYDAAATSLSGMTTVRRGDMPVLWDSPAKAISFGNSTALPESVAVTPRDTAPGVIAYKVLFIRADGTFSETYVPPTQANPTRAVGLALAVLDDVALSRLTTGQVAELRARLEGAATGRQSALADWEKAVATPGFGGGGLPKSAAQGLKLFERYAPLPDL